LKKYIEELRISANNLAKTGIWHKYKYVIFQRIKKTGWETLLWLGLLESGRQDSNLRPSAPKALNNPSEALGFRAISTFLPGSA